MLQAISPFLTMFSTAMHLYCIKMRHCVVNDYKITFIWSSAFRSCVTCTTSAFSLVIHPNITFSSICVHGKYFLLFISLGYNYSEYKMIAHEAKINAKSPTVVLLDHNMDLTLGKLFAILKYEMERTDVVELLENFTGFRLPEKDNEEGIGNQQTDEMSEKENDGIQAERRQISERQDRGVEVLYNRKDQQKLAVNERTIMSDSQRNENIFQSLAHPVETLHEPLGQPKESNEVTDISSLNLAKEGKHMLAGMVEDIELCNEHTKIIDLSLEENRLHAVETSVNDQNTKLTVDTCGIPVDGSEPNLSRQMLFPQQECEKPGPYLPVTGSASSSDLSQEKFFREFSVQSQEASEDPSAVDHVVEPCDSSLISLGHAYSIHHHEGQTVDDCQDTNDEMLSNSEERADILRKAQKPIPKVADLDFDKVEFEHDRVDDTGLRHNTNSVSDTGSYEIPSSIVLPPDLNEETSQQKFHLGSPLFRRRASGVSQELSDKITDCTNNNDHALRLSEAVQESASPRASARGEIDSDNEYRTGGFFVSHDRDEDDVDNSKSSFPWMHSLIVVGTAAVATLAYKSLKG